ncbi:MAG: hypothetical protein M3X11_14850 [Acidobacteriota bacterium]|nr:hypothetical protein [Acidobacteriota bacterium]
MNCKDTQASIDSATRRAQVSQSASTHIAGCLDCHQYSDQSTALLALLGAQPRVEAPADFAFHLRARIARTQHQPAGPFAFLKHLFGQSFSIKQAAASLAALAVMAAATTFYFTGSTQPTVNDNIMVAQVENPGLAAASKAIAESEKSIPELMDITSKPVTPVAKAASNPRANAVKLMPATLPPEANIATNRENMDRVYNRVRGQVLEMPTRTMIGAEGSIAMAKPAVYTPGF